MRKSKFTESQIVTTLKQVEAEWQVKDVCRELGISDATYYVWKSKYGGMEASDVQRLSDIEAEHAKLKRMYAELGMENLNRSGFRRRLCNQSTSSLPQGRLDSRVATVSSWPEAAATSSASNMEATVDWLTKRLSARLATSPLGSTPRAVQSTCSTLTTTGSISMSRAV